MKLVTLHLVAVLVAVSTGFAPPAQQQRLTSSRSTSSSREFSSLLRMSVDDDGLDKKFGGYTAKQRLREEVESPFRTVRLFFFGASTGSAMLALYFSTFSAIKAAAGGFADAPPLEEALQSCAINAAAAVICGYLTYRDWNVGNANLARIAKGGALAKLIVTTPSGVVSTLSEYRRNARVLIAAGGVDYIQELCRTLSADQLPDANTFAAALEASDVIIVPVLLQGDGFSVGDSKMAWMATVPREGDRNFDANRAAQVLAFPRGASQWAEYLQTEIETCQKQGFDVVNKGFTITVKKNGRILRRATGQPPLAALIDTMEVFDGSRFGMPGDDEKYGSSSSQ